MAWAFSEVFTNRARSGGVRHMERDAWIICAMMLDMGVQVMYIPCVGCARLVADRRWSTGQSTQP